MHKKMPATTWLAWVHVFNYFTCLLDRGASDEVVFTFNLDNDMKKKRLTVKSENKDIHFKLEDIN